MDINLNFLLCRDGSIKYKVVTWSLHVFSKTSGVEFKKVLFFCTNTGITNTVTVYVGKLLRVFNCLAIIIYSYRIVTQ